MASQQCKEQDKSLSDKATHQDVEIVLEEKPSYCWLSFLATMPSHPGQLLIYIDSSFARPSTMKHGNAYLSIIHRMTWSILKFLKCQNVLRWLPHIRQKDRSVDSNLSKQQSVEGTCFGFIPSKSRNVFIEIQFLTSSCPHSASFALNWMRKQQKVLHTVHNGKLLLKKEFNL